MSRRDDSAALPQPITPAGRYVPTVVHDSLIYVSGQVAVEEGVIRTPGQLGGQVSLEQGIASARAAGRNVLARLDSDIGLDRIERIVSVVVYVASTPEFEAIGAVADSCSAVFEAQFGAGMAGTRTAIGVVALPRRSPVEVTVIAKLR